MIEKKGKRTMVYLRKLFQNNDGVTLIEYALIAVLIAIGLLAVLGDIRETVKMFYESVSEAFE